LHNRFDESETGFTNYTKDDYRRLRSTKDN